MQATQGCDALPFWLALNRIHGLGSVAASSLLAHLDCPSQLFDRDSSFYLQLPAKFREQLKSPPWDQVDTDLEWLAAQTDRCILTLEDSAYPPLLKETQGAPLLLFVQGDPDALLRRQIAIVGSRKPTQVGARNARHFSSQLCLNDWIVTSGLALGIDTAAHQGALAVEGQTIAVLGTGLDVIYPKTNRQLAEGILHAGGALVSEFPTGTIPKPANFPRRNRIISGMASGTLIVEAAQRSGSMITARLSMEQNREVFAIPGSIRSPQSSGCHQLIQQGAKLTTSIEDILEELTPAQLPAIQDDRINSPNRNNKLSRDESKILNLLTEEPQFFDEIINQAGLTAGEVSSILLSLELNKLVDSLPGNRFSRRIY